MKVWHAAVALLAVAVALAVTIVTFSGEADTLRAELAASARHQRTANEQVTALRTELDSKSLTGDLLTCTDLRAFEQGEQVTTSGNDSFGGSITAWSGLGNWLPSHCYKP